MSRKPIPKRVLIVDDDPSARLLLERLLQGPDLEVAAAASGEEGIKAARAHPPDLIVMDVVMPGMGGLEAIREIKSIRALEAVPILVLTGNADPENIRAAVDLGAEDFLAKSHLVAEEAPARIRRVLGLPARRPSRTRQGR